MSSLEFAEILADYGLQQWGNDWEQTAFLASTLAVQKSGQAIEDYRTLIPKAFDFLFVTDTNSVDNTEMYFRSLANGRRG